VGTRALGKYIENKPGSSNDSTFENTFQIALLAWGEWVVKHHQLGLVGLFRSLNFVELALPDKIFSRGRAATPGNKVRWIAASGSHQFLKFQWVLGGFPVIHGHLNQNGAFAPRMALKKATGQLGASVVDDVLRLS
jgi:hypothetical protein